LYPSALLLIAVLGAGTNDSTSWLNEVGYLISDNERKEYLALTSAEDRAAFVEEFWRVRDQDPSSERNEFREAYLTRVAEAHRMFGAGTDRARVWVLNGKPDQRLVYPNMKWEEPLPTQSRSRTEILDQGVRGGAVEGSRPVIRIDSPEAEIWTYFHSRAVAALAGPLELIFMKVPDGELAVLYAARHARNPLLSARMLGNTPLFQGSRAAFSDYTVVYAGPPRYTDLTAFYRELLTNSGAFDTLDLVRTVSQIRRPLDDAPERRALRRKLVEEVRSALFFEELPARLQVWRFEGAGGWAYLPFAVSVPGDGLEGTTELTVVAEIRRDGKTVAELQDQIDLAAADRERLRRNGLTYQSRFAVQPGPQVMTLHLLDRSRGRLYSVEHPLSVKAGTGFRLSDPVICQDIQEVRQSSDPLGVRTQRDWIRLTDLNPLLADSHLMIPDGDGRFRRKDRLSLFFEIYRPEMRNDRPRVEIRLRLFGAGREVASLPPVVLTHLTQDGERKISYAQTLDLGRLPTGRYRLAVEATDLWSGNAAVAESGFEVY
jgi:GWxTD domain-containing protein